MIKGVSETIQIEAKEQKRGFLSILLDTLGANLLGNILAGKGAIAKRKDWGKNKAGYGNEKEKRVLPKRQDQGIIRVGHGSKESSIKLDF